jgi:hypothetical protein
VQPRQLNTRSKENLPRYLPEETATDPNLVDSYMGARETYRHEPHSPNAFVSEDGCNSYFVGTPKDPNQFNSGVGPAANAKGRPGKPLSKGLKPVLPTALLRDERGPGKNTGASKGAAGAGQMERHSTSEHFGVNNSSIMQVNPDGPDGSFGKHSNPN